MAIVSLSCENCGGNLHYSLKDLKLHCNQCDSKFEPKIFAKQIESQTFSVSNCTNCGAKIMSSEINTKCLYCGSVVTNTEEIIQKIDYILPFTLNEEFIIKIFEENARMIQNKNKNFNFYLKENIISIDPIYIPVRLFDLGVNFNTKYICEKEEREKLVFYKKKKKMDRNFKFLFSNIMIDGSLNITNEHMIALEPFNYDKLIEFNPCFLLGVNVEKYNDTIENIDNYINCKINNMVSEHQSVFLESNIENLQDFQYKFDKTILNSKYCLLPIYKIKVKYNKREATFLMNGMSGKMVSFDNIYKDINLEKSMSVLPIFNSLIAMMLFTFLFSFTIIFAFLSLVFNFYLIFLLIFISLLYIFITYVRKKGNKHYVKQQQSKEVYDIYNNVTSKEILNEKEEVLEQKKIKKDYID